MSPGAAHSIGPHCARRNHAFGAQEPLRRREYRAGFGRPRLRAAICQTRALVARELRAAAVADNRLAAGIAGRRRPTNPRCAMPLDGVWKMLCAIPESVGFALATLLLVLWVLEGEHPGIIGGLVQRAVAWLDSIMPDTEPRRWR